MEEHIAFALRQPETGVAVTVVFRMLGISESTFYNRKRKIGRQGVGDMRQLQRLEEEINLQSACWRT